MPTPRRPKVEPRPLAHARVVRDLMTADVVTTSPEALLEEVVERLADTHVSGLAVVDRRHRLVGVVSASDVVSAEAEGPEDPALRLAKTTVAEIMARRPLVVSPDCDLREAALQMEYGDVHRLFVEEDGKLVGVISRSDINRAFATGTIG